MRYYSATAGAMSLTAGISSSDTSITLDVVVGLPSSFPYSLVLDPGQVSEEIVQVSAAAGSTLTVSRGFDGTSAQSHSLGATVRHMMIPMDLREPQQHLGASSGVHGVAGAVVGTTDVQDLSNKRAVAANKDTAGLVVKGAAGQVEDYFRVEDNGGTTVLESTPNAALSTGPVEAMNPGQANLFKRAWRATASAADVVAGIVKAAASQTADIFQVQKSDGTVLAKFDKDGNLTAPDVTATGTAWTDITINSGYAAQGTVSKPQVRRIGKQVFIRWGWSSTGLTANANHVVGQLPAGFAPAVEAYVTVISSTTSSVPMGVIGTNGSVQVRTGGVVPQYALFSGSWLID